MSVFNQERARTYDASARTTMPGYEALHEMARDGLAAYVDPDQPARVLLLGVGTGYEAEQLQQRFPLWKLIGVDPSEPMLEVARQRLGDRVELRQGVLDDFDDLMELDAVLSIGVLHHLSTREEQPLWIRSIGRRLRVGGVLLLGCQVGPYRAEGPRMRTLQARWQTLGGNAEQMAERMRAFQTMTLPPDRSALDAWVQDSGLTLPESLFRTGYFQLLAAEKARAVVHQAG